MNTRAQTSTKVNSLLFFDMQICKRNLSQIKSKMKVSLTAPTVSS